MKTTHPFVAPVLGSTQSKVNMEAYEQAIDQYNEGNYLGAFYQLLDHLNPEFRTKYGNANGTEFHIPHGSILVHIRIADDRLHISADFLILPEKGRVAMLRQVADLNINRLMLPRFRKEDDRLMMEYACPLSQSHPHKLYFILRNICHVGDRYDDEFCTKFGAQRSYEPQVTPYPEEEVTRIYEAVRQTCRETLDAVKEYETERKYGYSWNVIDIALYKIAYFAHPQGQLLNDLDKAVDDMDKELPVAELVAKGKAFLERLLAMPREEMARDLYLVDTLVSTKRRSSLNNVQENFKEVYQEATEAIESENFERSTVRILYKFYEMYYYNDVQDDLNAVVAGALGKSAGKTMEEASEILYEALEKIMEDDLSADDGDFDAGELGIAGAAAAEQVQQMAYEGLFMGFLDMHRCAEGELSPLAVCSIRDHGREEKFCTAFFGSFSPSDALHRAVDYAGQHNTTTAYALEYLTVDMQVDDNAPEARRILDRRRPSLIRAMESAFAQCPAVAAKITFDTDQREAIVDYNPLWLERQRLSNPRLGGMEGGMKR